MNVSLSTVCKFNGVHITESKRHSLHFIYQQLISRSNIKKVERASSALARENSIFCSTFNEQNGMLNLRMQCGMLIFIGGVSLLERDAYFHICGDECCSSAVVSGYWEPVAITHYHIFLFFFYIFGRSIHSHM